MMGREYKNVKFLFDNLKRSRLRKFPKLRKKLDAPNAQGVYIIYNPQEKVLHVGRTPKGKKGIAQRLRNHMNGASSFTKKYLKGRGAKLRKGYKFRYFEVPDARTRALLEAYAIGCLCPEHLGLGLENSIV